MKKKKNLENKVNYVERDLSQFIQQQIHDLKQAANKNSVKRVKELGTKTFDEFDIDGDGEISMEEFRLLIGEKRALMAIAESNRADQLHVNKVLRTKLESDPEAVERDKHLQKMFAERTGLNLELKKATDELKNAESKLRLLRRHINYKKEEVQNELLIKSMERGHEQNFASTM